MPLRHTLLSIYSTYTVSIIFFFFFLSLKNSFLTTNHLYHYHNNCLFSLSFLITHLFALPSPCFCISHLHVSLCPRLSVVFFNLFVKSCNNAMVFSLSLSNVGHIGSSITLQYSKRCLIRHNTVHNIYRNVTLNGR